MLENCKFKQKEDKEQKEYEQSLLNYQRDKNKNKGEAKNEK